MRNMTGALAFFDSNAETMREIALVILLPKPPPVYSLITTTWLASMCSQRATAGTVCDVLCVEQ